MRVFFEFKYACRIVAYYDTILLGGQTMELLDKKIDQLKQLLMTYENDELSLRDLDYLDGTFEELIEDIRKIKNDIVNDRFQELLDELNDDF